MPRLYLDNTGLRGRVRLLSGGSPAPFVDFVERLELWSGTSPSGPGENSTGLPITPRTPLFTASLIHRGRENLSAITLEREQIGTRAGTCLSADQAHCSGTRWTPDFPLRRLRSVVLIRHKHTPALGGSATSLSVAGRNLETLPGMCYNAPACKRIRQQELVNAVFGACRQLHPSRRHISDVLAIPVAGHAAGDLQALSRQSPVLLSALVVLFHGQFFQVDCRTSRMFG